MTSFFSAATALLVAHTAIRQLPSELVPHTPGNAHTYALLGRIATANMTWYDEKSDKAGWRREWFANALIRAAHEFDFLAETDDATRRFATESQDARAMYDQVGYCL